ncbi:MAG: glutamine synthetase [Hyphomicrobiales bacterium]|nr:glutamine synthetase [Hyphomicrobiales bacterium]MDE2284525.1 glutamine synthetase [Hyphomicrobiales bacterium]
MAARQSTADSFVQRHGLWSAEQARAANRVAQAIKKHKLELVRFSFADQHGVLRGKTVVAAEAAALMAAGVTMTTTLLAKDTAHKTVYPVFTAGGGFAIAEMQGGGDFVMVADPTTFRVLPWATDTGWLLCDIYFTNGKKVPFSTRQVLRDALDKLGAAGFDFRAGLEVEFHLFKLENPRLSPADATWPPQAPEVSLLNQGYQYLTETRFDQVAEALEPIRRGIEALGLPLRSLEIELGPSQCEFTFRPQPGFATADTMILFRAAVKQIARRHGMLASFMCRPALPNLFSSGWHLHQSLIARKSGRNAFAGDERDGLAATGLHYLGGLLAHAHAAAAFTTPTVNGYKRYRAYALAPDRAIWARDNRGVMLRVMGRPGDPATHLENRVGEPAANPYLYIASQIYAGLDGIAHQRAPGPSADTPYETKAQALPKNLGEAVAALRASKVFRDGFGNAFVDYFSHLKEAEFARFTAETGGEGSDVTAWEQNEYFDLF